MYDCKVKLTAGTSSTYSEAVKTCTGVKGVAISRPTRLLAQPGVAYITLVWSPPTEGHSCVDQYALQWKVKEDHFSRVEIILPGNTSEYQIDHLEPCASYSFILTHLSIYWGKQQNGSKAEISG